MSAVSSAWEMRPGFRRLREAKAAVRAGGAATVFAVLAGVFMLRVASGLLVPMTIALLVSFLIGPAVRWLRRFHVPSTVSAFVLVFGAAGLATAGIVLLSRPASDWLQRAPDSIPQIERKIRGLVRPISAIEQTADQVQRAAAAPGSGAVQKVALQAPPLMARVTSGTLEISAAVFTVLFLAFFLASTENLFKRKLIGLVSDRLDQARAVRMVTELEMQTARYLALTAAISLGLGLLTFLLLSIAGLPNAALWATVAAVLNFIPYVGTIISAALIGAAALLSFDGLERTFVVLAAYIVVHGITGNLITPMLLGRALPLNRVALFVSLVFWTWAWGIAGAVLAVPVTVMIKIVCDHVDRLKPVAVLLDS